ncbi:M-phase phosphoprotein 6 [Nylanderia fulva]|uniref:M-phase phosphoprotein 6 n=1 Tax=Nylanderia fulva TaxID=613905 RepID=UPI0010FAFFE8|nr:M-phase phosphoprotein 6 [Nylanderia fulva]
MESKRLALSKSILEMKFMKRTKDKVEKQQFQQEGEEYFGSSLTSRMKEASGKFFMEPSYIFCEGLIEGRLSFQGMNPMIEKLMEAKENEKRAQTETKEEVDVSDEQMTVQWQKMRTKFDVMTHRKPQNKAYRKSQHSKTGCKDEPMEKKPKFLKPVD